MAATLKLDHKVTKTSAGTTSLALTVIGEGISSKVFAIEVLPKSADDKAPWYRFSHVCSPSELVEFPEDAPADCCYFRVSEAEFIFDTEKPVQRVLDCIRLDLTKLVRAFNELDSKEAVSEGSETIN